MNAFIENRQKELRSKLPDPQCYPTSYERILARIDELDWVKENLNKIIESEEKELRGD